MALYKKIRFTFQKLFLYLDRSDEYNQYNTVSGTQNMTHANIKKMPWLHRHANGLGRTESFLMKSILFVGSSGWPIMCTLGRILHA